MCCYDDCVDDYLQILCTCEPYFPCEWHKRLKAGETRLMLEEEMKEAVLTEIAAEQLRWEAEQSED